ncbi:geranylgeranyl pyrophosphate synthetase [Niveomyces insectorum RCEF 264]|uniref:Geranylgeranyl pyrophosphate synthetase n=1 Tax=Niveomyces insectorum RCEF 264 TaxID=1081102 RepID=A0A167MDZ0_9HYPO|nr:geranylgeranyl pyrophosphate synthetase [Niveomyces insectorum RCEF 264]
MLAESSVTAPMTTITTQQPSTSTASSSSRPQSLSFLHSPNAIPPRRSSTGQHQHQQFTSLSLVQQHQEPEQQQQQTHSSSRSRRHHHHNSSSSSTASAGGSKSTASILRSVPESDWINGPPTRRPRKPSITMASLAAGTMMTTAAASANIPAVSGGAAADGDVPGGADKTHAGSSGSSSSGSGSHTPTLPPLPAAAAAAAALAASASFPTATLLQPAPPPDPQRYATEDFNFGARRTWSDAKERIVRGPFDYLNNTRGKEFRTQLINAFNGWLEVPPEPLAVITRVVGMLHTASLLVDDVEDASSLRRGLPVTHNIFGVPQTINSANYVYFLALQELQTLRNPRALVLFAEELCNLHRGQGMDLFWRDTLTCPTEDDYLEMVGHKTGGLFRLGIKLMQAESRSLVDCVPLVNLLGLLFQIQDDYRNLMAPAYAQNKGLCEDLTEGKFSFPVIHSIRATPANLQLLHILRQKTTDPDVKRYAVAHMERTGSFAYTREVLAVLTARARAQADALDEGKGRSQAVHAILDKLVVE